MGLWGHAGRRGDRRVLNRRRERPGTRLAVRRGAVGVGVVQGLGAIGGREDRAGGCRGFGPHGRWFRRAVSADAYRRGPSRRGRHRVVQPGNTAGFYGHAAGRGTRRGVAQLEVTINVRNRTARRSPTHRPTPLDVTANFLSRNPDQAPHHRTPNLEVTPTRSHFTAQPLSRCPQLEVPVAGSPQRFTPHRSRRPQRKIPVGIPGLPDTLGIRTGIPVDANPTDTDLGIAQRPRRHTLRLGVSRARNRIVRRPRRSRTSAPAPPLRLRGPRGPRGPPLPHPLVHGPRPPTTARATPYSPDSTRFAGRGAGAGQRPVSGGGGRGAWGWWRGTRWCRAPVCGAGPGS